MNNTHTFSIPFGDGTLTLETGKLAGQANGAVTLRHGDTVILATATAASQPREGADFFPLTVDYEERLYAAGKIPGGFFKREGRPGEQAILLCRLTDRPLRPMFPQGFRNDVNIVVTALSPLRSVELTTLAVDRGAATLVDGPGWQGGVLINGGDDREAHAAVLPFLRAAGVDRLGGLVLACEGAAEAAIA